MSNDGIRERHPTKRRVRALYAEGPGKLTVEELDTEVGEFDVRIESELASIRLPSMWR